MSASPGYSTEIEFVHPHGRRAAIGIVARFRVIVSGGIVDEPTGAVNNDFCALQARTPAAGHYRVQEDPSVARE
jgi:hypothetical protein